MRDGEIILVMTNRDTFFTVLTVSGFMTKFLADKISITMRWAKTWMHYGEHLNCIEMTCGWFSSEIGIFVLDIGLRLVFSCNTKFSCLLKLKCRQWESLFHFTIHQWYILPLVFSCYYLFIKNCSITWK